jgi:Uma2 family endonuclease
MSATAPPGLLTPDDFLNGYDEAGIELVKGRLVEKPMGSLSAFVGGRLLAFVTQHDVNCEYGWPFAADAGIQCFPNDPLKVRKPDMCYVRREPDGPPVGWLTVVPDLVVEVISPNDKSGETDVKLGEYLAAGVPLVWHINPLGRSVTAFRPNGDAKRLTEEDLLRCEDIIPGFECMISDLFPPIPRTAPQEPT